MSERILHKFVPNPERPGKFMLVQMTQEEIATVPLDHPLRAVNEFLVPLTQQEIEQRAAEEAAAAAEAPRRAILAQLAEIDRLTGMVRGVREIGLISSALVDKLVDAGVQGFTEADRTSTNKGIIKLQQVEALAAQLRAELAALP